MAAVTRSARSLISHSGLHQSLKGSLSVAISHQVRLASTEAAKKGSSSISKSKGNDNAVILGPQQEYITGVSRLREHYRGTVQDDLMVLTYNHSFKPKAKIPEGVRVELKGNKHIKPAPNAPSPRHIPELVKIDVHCMMKEALVSKFNLLSGFMAIQSITGEMPEIIHSKKGVHPWKLRAGNPIGCKVTLKGDKMYQFLDKLVEVVLPRMKEWPGLPESAGDATGNIGMGFPPSAMSLFPEIESNFDMFPRMTGFDVTFTTTAKTNLDARLLLSGFNMPFQQKIRSPPVAKTGTSAAAASPSSIDAGSSA
ncbi:ribosomal protein L5 domain-containing protein [Gamsiella multidivaricata]|uniref:ribosomal protein L5 domain-containing protein n=1 Tax=Gamsiella multidivaricata TaxID=101098 RepID=UPI00221FD0D0|nr:ribosomal protein L5 domain-containing protein [Gamsiella multidivaricata]KAG0365611.1 hypothetical protein BGZ54_006372 [Gamsiella multidivaricata]KAI7828174.1 ribosomal protein L5 domain-containing protein [Gamsiella multidivaricata]